jgi:hypothetical protein
MINPLLFISCAGSVSLQLSADSLGYYAASPFVLHVLPLRFDMALRCLVLCTLFALCSLGVYHHYLELLSAFLSHVAVGFGSWNWSWTNLATANSG